jgi:hypothetical protein
MSHTRRKQFVGEDRLACGLAREKEALDAAAPEL